MFILNLDSGCPVTLLGFKTAWLTSPQSGRTERECNEYQNSWQDSDGEWHYYSLFLPSALSVEVGRSFITTNIQGNLQSTVVSENCFHHSSTWKLPQVKNIFPNDFFKLEKTASISKINKYQTWWLMSVIPAFERLQQDVCYELWSASSTCRVGGHSVLQCCSMRPCHKINKWVI